MGDAQAVGNFFRSGRAGRAAGGLRPCGVRSGRLSTERADFKWVAASLQDRDALCVDGHEATIR